MARPLTGKVIIVIGTIGGIGAATVKRFAIDRATIVASGRNADRLSALKSIGPDIVGHRSEVSIEDKAKHSLTAR